VVGNSGGMKVDFQTPPATQAGEDCTPFARLLGTKPRGWGFLSQPVFIANSDEAVQFRNQ